MCSTAKMYPNYEDLKSAAYVSPPQASPGHAYAARPVKAWSTGLCHCFDDPSNCCVTCWFPCITFGHIAEIVDMGQTNCALAGLIFAALAYVGCPPCLYSWEYRTKLRVEYSLQEDPCDDCCVHFCCIYCALCQEYRELKNRGFKPALGWMANADRMNGVAMAAPFVAPGMTRYHACMNA